MSRIGKQPIVVPQGVKVQIDDGTIRAEAQALYTRIALPHLPPFPHDLLAAEFLEIIGCAASTIL